MVGIRNSLKFACPTSPWLILNRGYAIKEVCRNIWVHFSKRQSQGGRVIRRSARGRAGVTLLLVILVLAALLSISIGIFSVVYGELRISGEISDSFVALFASDAGMEKLFYADRSKDSLCPGIAGSCTFSSVVTLPNNACISNLSVSRSGQAVTLFSIASYNRGGCSANSPAGVLRSFSAFYTKNNPSGFPTPVAQWAFNDGGGTNAADEIVDSASGTTEDGTLGNYLSGTQFAAVNSLPTWRNLAGSNYALSFDGASDGSGDAVTVITHPRLDNLGPLSISAWIYPRTLNANSILIDKWWGLPGGFRFQIAPTAGGNSLRFVASHSTADLNRDSDPTAGSPPSPLISGTWQHVAVTWDGKKKAAGIILYVNGREVGGYVNDADARGNHGDDSQAYLWIGYRNPNLGLNAFNGCMDNVRIWSSELTSDNILGDYAFAKDFYATLSSSSCP